MSDRKIRAKKHSGDATRAASALPATLDLETSFLALFGNSAIASAIADHNGKLHRVNAALCALLDYEESELTGLNVTSVVHPDDFIENFDEFDRRVANSGSEPIEQRFLTSTGNIVAGIVSVSLLRAEEGGGTNTCFKFRVLQMRG